jgi:hypothetical protein
MMLLELNELVTHISNIEQIIITCMALDEYIRKLREAKHIVIQMEMRHGGCNTMNQHNAGWVWCIK